MITEIRRRIKTKGEGKAIFEINATTLAALGAIGGALTGAITFLFRQLIESKNEIIKLHQDALSHERENAEYWRDNAVKAWEATGRVTGIAERVIPPTIGR